MSKEKNLGEFEIYVMAALVRLGAQAYGVSIKTEIENRAGRSVSLGAIYSTLSRLEAKGLVISRLGEATAERGGRAKKYFELTADGRGQLAYSLDALGKMVQGISPWPKPTSSLQDPFGRQFLRA